MMITLQLLKACLKKTNLYLYITETFIVLLSRYYPRSFSEKRNLYIKNTNKYVYKTLCRHGLQRRRFFLRNFGPIVWNKLLPNKFKSASTLEEF